jgi:magnesium transporter
VIPPPGQSVVEEPDFANDGSKLYHIPAKSRTRTDAVAWWRLACVIAGAVSAICVWGTLVGSMLPLFFCRIGVDPGIASSPFVATFVDVTGIMIYFTIAGICIPQLWGG